MKIYKSNNFIELNNNLKKLININKDNYKTLHLWTF